MMMHLGYYIKARELLVLGKAVEEKWRAQQNNP